MGRGSRLLTFGVCAAVVLAAALSVWAVTVAQQEVTVGGVKGTAILTAPTNPPRVGQTIQVSITVTNTTSQDKTVTVDPVLKLNGITVYDPPPTTIVLGAGKSQTFGPYSALVLFRGTYTGSAVITVGGESATVSASVKVIR